MAKDDGNGWKSKQCDGDDKNKINYEIIGNLEEEI